jgi:hypothetical protein
MMTEHTANRPADPKIPSPPPAAWPEPLPAKAAAVCDRVAVVWLAAVLLIGLVTFPRYGVTTDEPIRAHTGANWWRWMATGEEQYLPAGRLRYYGAAFDMIGVAATNFHIHVLGGTDEYAPKHLLIFLTMWAGLLGTYRLAGRLGPQPLPLAALVLLTLMPRFYGSFNNPKDIPFATTFVWAAFALVRWLEAPTLRNAGWAGLASGVAAAVRPFGALWLPAGIIAAGVVIAWRLLRRPDAPEARAAAEIEGRPTGLTGAQVAVFAAAGIAFTYLLWPTLWISPPTHLYEAIRHLSRYPDGGSHLYFGEWYNYDDFTKKSVAVPLGATELAVPAHLTYIPVWVGITVPVETVLTGLVGGAWLLIRRLRGRPVPSGWAWLLVAAWLLTPWIGAVIRGSNYSRTVRHFLFLMPPVALFAGLGVAALTAWARRNPVGWVPVALAGLLCADTAATMYRLFPYESVYFSRAIGGVKGAEGRFDVEYWNQTFQECFEWLDARGERPVNVLSTAGTDVARYHATQHGFPHNSPRLQYLVSMVAQNWENRLPGTVLHTIERDGVPLAVIKKIDPLNALSRMEIRTAAGWRTLRGSEGRFDVTEAGVKVPPLDPLDALAAESSEGEKISVRWTLKSGAAQTIPMWIGCKGPGTLTVNGRAHKVGDALRYRSFDAYAGMMRMSIPLDAGDNVFEMNVEIRHDPSLYVHWPTDVGVTEK